MHLTPLCSAASNTTPSGSFDEDENASVFTTGGNHGLTSCAKRQSRMNNFVEELLEWPCAVDGAFIFEGKKLDNGRQQMPPSWRFLGILCEPFL